MELIYKNEVFAVFGAAMDIQRELGSGFLESVYQEALEMELANRQIPFESQKPIKITYKGKTLKKEFVADLICFTKIIVE
jgi:GxxExxY protein